VPALARQLRDLCLLRRVCWAWYAALGSRAAQKRCLREQGVPRSLRLRFWMHQSRADCLSRDGGGVSQYRQCLGKSRRRAGKDGDTSWFALSQQPGIEGEVARDVTRTFAQRVLFRVKHGLGRRMLYNVLTALAVHEPKVGYCQGMNFVVAVVLLVALGCEEPGGADEMALAAEGLPAAVQDAVEAQCFWLMVAFLSRLDMRELWRPGVPQLKLRIYQFERLIGSRLPATAAHLRAVGMGPDFFASQWFLTLMSYNTQVPRLVRLWDCLLVDGWKTIFKAGIAVLMANEKRVLRMSLEQISEFFRPPIVPGSGPSTAPQDTLPLEAIFAIKVSTRELADLEGDYITQVLLKNSIMRNGKPAKGQAQVPAKGQQQPPGQQQGQQQQQLRRQQQQPQQQAGQQPSQAQGPPSKEASVSLELAAGDDIFVDHRLAAALRQELDSLDADARSDFRYLRGKIEDAERLFAQRDAEFRVVAREFLETRTTLDELKRLKREASEQLVKELTRVGPGAGAEPAGVSTAKIEQIEQRIHSVGRKVDELLWRSSEMQVEMEEIREKKEAFSHQLCAVLQHTEQLKSQSIKQLWSQVST
jgi:hypothetical protein